MASEVFITRRGIVNQYNNVYLDAVYTNVVTDILGDTKNDDGVFIVPATLIGNKFL